MEDADWAVLEIVQDEILNPDVVAFALCEALKTLTTAPDTLTARLDALRTRELAMNEQICGLTEAIATGGDLAALVAALKSREQERRGSLRIGRTLKRSSEPADSTRRLTSANSRGA